MLPRFRRYGRLIYHRHRHARNVRTSKPCRRYLWIAHSWKLQPTATTGTATASARPRGAVSPHHNTRSAATESIPVGDVVVGYNSGVVVVVVVVWCEVWYGGKKIVFHRPVVSDMLTTYIPGTEIVPVGVFSRGSPNTNTQVVTKATESQRGLELATTSCCRQTLHKLSPPPTRSSCSWHPPATMSPGVGEPRTKVLAAPARSTGTSKLLSGHLRRASCHTE